jgi:hypothetical protein
MREREDVGENAGGNRPTHAIGVDGQQHTGCGHGVDVASVVAHTEARNDTGAQIGASERGGRNTGRAQADRVVGGDVIGVDVDGAVREPLPIDARIIVQYRERCRIEGGSALLIQQVARDAYSEWCHCH